MNLTEHCINASLGLDPIVTLLTISKASFLAEITHREFYGIDLSDVCENYQLYLRIWSYDRLASNDDGTDSVRTYNYLGVLSAELPTEFILTDFQLNPNITSAAQDVTQLQKRTECYYAEGFGFSLEASKRWNGNAVRPGDDGYRNVFYNSWYSKWDRQGKTYNRLSAAYRGSSGGSTVNYDISGYNYGGWPTFGADWFWFSTFAQRGWERFGWRDYWKSECNGCNIGKQDVIQFMTGEF